MNIRIAIIGDNLPVCRNLSWLVNATEGFSCIAACLSVEEACQSLPALNPDVVVMGIQLPGHRGIIGIATLKVSLPKTKVIIFTLEQDADLALEAKTARARIYLIKRVSPVEVIEAIKEAYNGDTPTTPRQVAPNTITAPEPPPDHSSSIKLLSPKENQVLRLLAKGLRSKEIAGELGNSLGTVDTHIRHILKKLEVRSRAEAVRHLYLPHKQSGAAEVAPFRHCKFFFSCNPLS